MSGSFGIRDVPCLSCQHGYSRPHSCDVPDYCACDQWQTLHTPPDVSSTIDEQAQEGVSA